MDVNLKPMLKQTVGLFLIFALALFLPAGTLVWAAGWVFLWLFFGFFIMLNLWLLKHNPGLFQERMRLSRPNQQGWDKLLFPVLMLFPFALLSFIALDAVRFDWSSISIGLQIIGALFLLGSFYLFFLTFRENSYLSTVVRIQEERGHTVISTGPYQHVRHPMYAALVVFVFGTSLLLGSWVGVLCGAIFVLVLAGRAVLEERTLRQQLQGYANYMTEVKYRIVPFVW